MIKFTDIISLLNEQNESQWLYNWFKNVPDQKIANTFVTTTFVMPTSEQILKGNFNFIKKISYSKKDILKIISTNNIIKVSPDQFAFLMEGDMVNFAKGKLPLASYIDTKVDKFGPILLSEANKTIARLTRLIKDVNQSSTNPSSTKKEYESDLSSIKRQVGRLEQMMKYSGKILIPDNITDTIKASGLDVGSAVSHEKMHSVYDATGETAKGLISKICTSKKCMRDKDGYFKEETEIYSYLFTIRQKMKMQPADVIDSVRLEKGPVDSTIAIVVIRNGKRVLLKDKLPTKSATIKAMMCCTGDFGTALKALHNTLAYNTTKTNDQDLAEATPVEKPEIGAGVDHHIYPSKHNPNIVYKLGTKEVVDWWYNDFKNNPDIFAHVYGRGSTKMKLKKDKNVFTPEGWVTKKAGTIIPIDYVKIEKLDAERAKNDWQEIDQAVMELSENDSYIFLDYVIDHLIRKNQPKSKYMEHVEDGIKRFFPELVGKFEMFMNLIDKLEEVKHMPDVHLNNFGYDKNGVLKCLDF